eukprot:357392-Chlamydomonas_euryale.AAC.9
MPAVISVYSVTSHAGQLLHHPHTTHVPCSSQATCAKRYPKRFVADTKPEGYTQPSYDGPASQVGACTNACIGSTHVCVGLTHARLHACKQPLRQ